MQALELETTVKQVYVPAYSRKSSKVTAQQVAVNFFHNLCQISPPYSNTRGSCQFFLRVMLWCLVRTVTTSVSRHDQVKVLLESVQEI